MPLLPGGGDTIVAIATPPGRGGLAMLRLSGPDAISIAARVLPGFMAVDRRAAYQELRDPDNAALLDRVVVTAFHGPRSYTGENMVEITVHGGLLVPSLALAAILRAGARQALPGEFTRRAVAAGKMDLLQAEAIGDLVDARSRGMHGVALRQLDGSLSREIDQLRNRVLDLEALLAYDIDFPAEDEGPVAPARVVVAVEEVLESLERLLSSAQTGEILREGAVVVIAGAPNVGKSSLFNALVGSNRAIVTEIPGTTRDAIEAVIDVRGWPIRLVDTAGLRETSDVVERLGIEVSEGYLERAELVIVAGDTATSLREALAVVGARAGGTILPVRTKSDLQPVTETDTLAISVQEGTGVAELLDLIARRLETRHGSWEADAPLLVRDRHRDAVRRARDEVRAFADAWREKVLPAPVAAVHLRAAVVALEEMIGAVDVEDVLERVFRTFCVGK